jgi:hypothetical protein
VDGVIAGTDPPLLEALVALAREARLVFLAGLPGTGKSLLLHQLAHVAHAEGRRVHLLQWDVARPVFEACPAGRRYPQQGGVTHGLIRLAVGRWARGAVAAWHGRHPAPTDLLIGETPLIGHRLIELARRVPDAAEPLLASAATHFMVPVPSRDLRAHLRAERARRAETPRHPREREDAPPDVLDALGHEVVRAAAALGVPAAAGGGTYDPATYRGVYQRLLVHRHAVVLFLDARLPVAELSPYDFRVPAADVVPGEAEATRAIEEVEARTAPAAVQRALEDWFRVDG